MVKEAIDVYIQGELWPKAKRCAAEMAPKYVNRVLLNLLAGYSLNSEKCTRGELDIAVDTLPWTCRKWEVFSITQVLYIAGRVYEHLWFCWVVRFSFIHYFRYEQYVEDAYVAFLKQKGQAEQVQNSMKNSFRSQA